jgi:exosortase
MQRQHISHRIAFVGALAMLGYPYAVVLRRLVHNWLTDPEMAHAVLVPFVILALLFHRRKTLGAIAPEPSWLGILPLGFGVVGYAMAVWGAGLFIATLAGIGSLCGVILLTLGRAIFRTMLAPLSLSVFALPRFALLYDPLTNPLQHLSATVATGGLRLLGVEASHSASLITVAGFPVLLAESCSGVRFLIPLLFLAALLVQLRPISRIVAVALMAATVPLAVMINAIRVGVLVYLAGTHQGKPPENLHTWLGYPLYGLALGVLLFLARLTEPLLAQRKPA